MLNFANMVRAYRGTILSVDDSVGQLYSYLQAIGELDNTLFIFTTDNGLLEGEHGMVDKRTMHEASIRLPLVVRYPGLTAPDAPKVIDEQVLTLDFAPTILDICGAEPLPRTHGRSWKTLVQVGDPEWRTSWYYEYNYEKQFPYTPNVRGVRTDRWKYIRYPHGDGSPDRHMAELYEIRSDPQETRNLINDPRYAPVVERLRQELDRLIREADGYPDKMPVDEGIKSALPDKKDPLTNEYANCTGMTYGPATNVLVEMGADDRRARHCAVTGRGRCGGGAGCSTEVVFACRQPGKGSHWYENFGYQAFDPQLKLSGSQGRLCRLHLGTGQLTQLLVDLEGSVRDPQVHYDGQKILFSYRRGDSDYYHLYEINCEGTRLRQLTDGPYDDIEPTYLPDGSIMFCSSRSNRWVNCWYSQVATLYRCDGSGRNIQPISANIEHDNTPWPLPDGRVIYQRWEYVDRSRVAFHHLWTANPDGTNQMVFYGNMHPGTVMLDAKPIPGTAGEVVAIFSPGHGRAEHQGAVTIVTPTAGPDEPASARQISRAAGLPRSVSPGCGPIPGRTRHAIVAARSRWCRRVSCFGCQRNWQLMAQSVTNRALLVPSRA